MKDQDAIIERLKDPNVQLCITGPALNRIFDFEADQNKLTPK